MRARFSLLSVIGISWLLFTPCHSQEQSTTASLVLIDIQPIERSELDSSTTLKATLDYQLPQGKGMYFIVAVFESTTPNMTFDGSFPNSRYKQLKSASGRTTYIFPMKYIFNDKRLAVPIRVRFLLNVGNLQGSSRTVAHTRWYEFQRRPKQ